MSFSDEWEEDEERVYNTVGQCVHVVTVVYFGKRSDRHADERDGEQLSHKAA